MTTSMSYRRYLRTAIVTAAGVPSTNIVAKTMNHPFDRGESCPKIAPTTGKKTNSTRRAIPTKASQRIWALTTGSAWRRRTTREAIASAAARSPAPAPTMRIVPAALRKASIPAGLANRTSAPEAPTEINRGLNASQTNENVAPMTSNQTTGRHRREGSLPSGKSKKTGTKPSRVSADNQSSHATHRAPGSEPGCTTSP
jgi:hypothetical protein